MNSKQSNNNKIVYCNNRIDLKYIWKKSSN